MPRLSDPDELWTVERRDGSDRIVVTFHGRVTEDAGRRSAAAFLALLGASAVDITFDVRDLESHEGAARKAWQDLLMPRRKQLRSMAIVSSSRVTRMAATVFAMVMGVPCQVYDDIESSVA